MCSESRIDCGSAAYVYDLEYCLQCPYRSSAPLVSDDHSPRAALMTTPTTRSDLSVVLPCLNEAETLRACLTRIEETCTNASIDAEIVVADNASTDGSREIAMSSSARLVEVSQRGYGNAIRGGIAASTGQYIIVGDADCSYDFSEIPKYLARLRNGYDLVMGCRRPTGGGQILPGAMPLTHRWIGNPLFTKLLRGWYGSPVNDVFCGLRGFSREFYDGIRWEESGMTFAVEMVIRAAQTGAATTEIPITLYPDERTVHGPHLSTLRDGWRTLRYILSQYLLRGGVPVTRQPSARRETASPIPVDTDLMVS
ncbi:MAG: glycosyltransferase family 2 protein [Planctomycetota bacterium]|nr:MAG: glycosyltransferase family 2 protein [Planctomycetota bacterium]REK25151.1 MAG: glycosyltransferase family 2 protein [Planctomycetota bacterium]REK38792.1 MAG: glycosyltransferase family 2 protein [Planctomycetota bacterium]